MAILKSEVVPRNSGASFEIKRSEATDRREKHRRSRGFNLKSALPR